MGYITDISSIDDFQVNHGFYSSRVVDEQGSGS